VNLHWMKKRHRAWVPNVKLHWMKKRTRAQSDAGVSSERKLWLTNVGRDFIRRGWCVQLKMRVWACVILFVKNGAW